MFVRLIDWSLLSQDRGPEIRAVTRTSHRLPNLAVCAKISLLKKIYACIMSRANNPTARNLSLPEELEKLEQSITLTLQGTLYLPNISVNTTNNQ